jgi:hypothetical protein
MLTRSHLTDSCWVCQIRFDHSNKKEDHHIIPRAYGGVDGPQVSLCDSHHSALHNISLRLFSKKPFKDLLTHTHIYDEKLLWLATVACNSRILTENDPNKKQVLVLSPNKETITKLKQLKKVYGNVSRERLIELAINKLYSQHFK